MNDFKVVGQLRCPCCKEHVQLDDKVYLDALNSIIHQKCYFKMKRTFGIKDSGTFKKMKFKYEFLNEYLQ